MYGLVTILHKKVIYLFNDLNELNLMINTHHFFTIPTKLGDKSLMKTKTKTPRKPAAVDNRALTAKENFPVGYDPNFDVLIQLETTRLMDALEECNRQRRENGDVASRARPITMVDNYDLNALIPLGAENESFGALNLNVTTILKIRPKIVKT